MGKFKKIENKYFKTINKIPLKKLAPPYPKPDRDASPVNKTANHAGFYQKLVFWLCICEPAL